MSHTPDPDLIAADAQIHPMAVIEPGARIGAGCMIGPFAVIGAEVTLGPRVIVKPHALVTGWTEIGEDSAVFSFASVGEVPQDLKYAGERTRLIVGKRCRIRENATLHIGTEGGGGVTRVGDDCLLMASSHIGHDVQVGNRLILANCAGLAGHCIVGDNVVIGGLAGVHQFVRIGDGAMIAGMAKVVHDVMPYGMVAGPNATLQGLNVIGLKRRGLSREDIAALRAAYKRLAEGEGPLVDLAHALMIESDNDAVRRLAGFFTESSDRNFLRPQ